MESSKKSVIISLIYKFLERCGCQGVSFIVQIVLARLLDPTDYGVLTLLTIFITISQVFVQSGFNTALIQRKDVTEKDYSSVFYLSLSIALIFFSAVYCRFLRYASIKKCIESFSDYFDSRSF